MTITCQNMIMKSDDSMSNSKTVFRIRIHSNNIQGNLYDLKWKESGKIISMLLGSHIKLYLPMAMG